MADSDRPSGASDDLRMRGSSRPVRAAKIMWAAPCSVIGLLFGAGVALFGGRAKRGPGIIEFTWRDDRAASGRLAGRLRYRAITFGHVVIAVTASELETMRRHELAHVRQYERWGPLFLVAYPCSGLWQWVRGRKAYRDNFFEVQARRMSGRADGHELAGDRSASGSSQPFGDALHS